MTSLVQPIQIEYFECVVFVVLDLDFFPKLLKSDKAVKNWAKTNGQISNVKATWKFALGQNGESILL
jgi:hypothetical protein